MSADAVIAGWVPWSAGDAARFGTKLAAAAELRRALDEAGFVIVPRVATEAMARAGWEHTGDPCWLENVGEAWSAMIQESQR